MDTPIQSANQASLQGTDDISLLEDIDIPILDEKGAFAMASDESDEPSDMSTIGDGGHEAITENTSPKIQPAIQKQAVARKPSLVRPKEQIIPKPAPSSPMSAIQSKPATRQPVMNQQKSRPAPIANEISVPEKPISSQKDEGIDLSQYARLQMKEYLQNIQGIGGQNLSAREIIKGRSRPAQTASQPVPAQKESEPLPKETEKREIPPETAQMSKPANKLEEIIVKVIEQARVTFPDNVMKERFYSFVRSRLRNIRDKFELAECLERPEKIGGMGYMEERANEIAELLEKETLSYLGIESKTFRSPAKPSDRQGSDAPKQAEGEPSKASPQMKYKEAILQTLEKLQQSPKADAKTNNTPSPIPGAATNQRIQVAPSAPKPQLVVRKAMPRVIRPTIEPAKQVVRDIERPHYPSINVVGPLDELGHMDLATFRKLGINAEMRAQKIKEKVDLLEQDSFALKSQGIDAWKNSPVNQMYLDIGKQSIINGKAVSSVIFDREQKKMPSLSVEEFQAIVDLNKSLRY